MTKEELEKLEEELKNPPQRFEDEDYFHALALYVAKMVISARIEEIKMFDYHQEANEHGGIKYIAVQTGRRLDKLRNQLKSLGEI